MMNNTILMVGAGSYLPEKVLTNDDLAAFVDTDDAWIQQRTGIRQRHMVGEGELTSDLAVAAAKKALACADLTNDDIDIIIALGMAKEYGKRDVADALKQFKRGGGSRL